MFLHRDERAIPPRRESPGRKPARAGRRRDATTALLAVAAVLVLFGPELVGTIYVLARALAAR